MNRFLSFVAGISLLAVSAFADPIDGKWISERKIERDGQTIVIVQSFELKADGEKLTGKFTTKFGEMEPSEGPIKNGKIDGDKFSFTTTADTPNGEITTNYSGALENGKLKGTADRVGGQSRPFEADRKAPPKGN